MAKYGQFTGYAPNPEIPGAYDFQLENGRMVTAGGQEGEALRARLDAYDAVNQPKVADISGKIGGPLDQIGGYDNAPPTPDQIQGFREQMQGGAPPSAPSPAAPPPAPGGQLGYGLRVSPQGTIQKFAPGSAGTSQAQLQEQSGKGVALPRSESVTNQGGMEGDPEYLNARAEGVVDQRLQLQKESDEAVASAEAESLLAAQRFETQKRLMGEEQARVADLQTRVARDEELKNKAFAEYTSSKVEPNRVFANPGSRMLMALAAGVGAYASTIAKTPNFALEIINQGIDRDIRAQEAAIRLKGDKANNLLSELRKSGMDLDQARAAAKGIQLQSERTQLEALRAKNGVPALQSHYEKLDMAAQQGLLEADEAYRQATIGKTTRTTNSVVEYPRAGSGGGWVDVGDQLGTAAKVQGLQKGEADIAKTNRDATKGPTASPEKRKALAVLAEGARLQKGLEAIPDDAILRTPDKGGPIDRTGAAVGDFFGGSGGGARLMRNEGELRQIADLNVAKEWIKAQRSVLAGQGALDKEGDARSERAISPGATAGEVKRAIADLYAAGLAANTAADTAGEAGGTIVTK